MRSSKKRNTTLSKAEEFVWRKLNSVSWEQMQNIFPRLSEFNGPRQKYGKQPKEETQNG